MPPEQPATTGQAYYAEQNFQSRGLVRGNDEIHPPTPSIQENHIRSISIRQLNHGYVVEVGCQTLAIESSSKLITLFAEYVANPIATEQKYREGKLV